MWTPIGITLVIVMIVSWLRARLLNPARGGSHRSQPKCETGFPRARSVRR